MTLHEEKCAEILEKNIKTHLKRGITVADASTRSGLSFSNAETGLHYLKRKNKGHVCVTDNGILVFTFPGGFKRGIDWGKLKRIFSSKYEQLADKNERRNRRKILAVIRHNKGRIAYYDILRSTGIKKKEFEKVIVDLLLHFNGKTSVAENGAIIYEFVELRKSAKYKSRPRKKPVEILKPVWKTREYKRPPSLPKWDSGLLFATWVAGAPFVTLSNFYDGHNESSLRH